MALGSPPGPTCDKSGERLAVAGVTGLGDGAERFFLGAADPGRLSFNLPGSRSKSP